MERRSWRRSIKDGKVGGGMRRRDSRKRECMENQEIYIYRKSKNI